MDNHNNHVTKTVAETPNAQVAPKTPSLAERKKLLEDKIDGGEEGGEIDGPERGAPHRSSIAGKLQDGLTLVNASDLGIDYNMEFETGLLEIFSATYP